MAKKQPKNVTVNIPIDTESQSLGACITEPTEHLPTILTICNPLTEDSSLRNQHPSDIFIDNPNPVQVPSWAKDSKCKPFLNNI
jgi:hypothetical protein